MIRIHTPDGVVEEDVGPVWRPEEDPPEGYATKAMAEAALRAALLRHVRAAAAVEPEPEKHSFGEAVAEWLHHVEFRRRRRQSTLRQYRSAAETLLAEFGAETPLEEIGADRVEAWRGRLLRERRSSRRTVQQRLDRLYSVLELAAVQGWIERNPMAAAEAVRRG